MKRIFAVILFIVLCLITACSTKSRTEGKKPTELTLGEESYNYGEFTISDEGATIVDTLPTQVPERYSEDELNAMVELAVSTRPTAPQKRGQGSIIYKSISSVPYLAENYAGDDTAFFVYDNNWNGVDDWMEVWGTENALIEGRSTGKSKLACTYCDAQERIAVSEEEYALPSRWAADDDGDGVINLRDFDYYASMGVQNYQRPDFYWYDDDDGDGLINVFDSDWGGYDQLPFGSAYLPESMEDIPVRSEYENAESIRTEFIEDLRSYLIVKDGNRYDEADFEAYYNFHIVTIYKGAAEAYLSTKLRCERFSVIAYNDFRTIRAAWMPGVIIKLMPGDNNDLFARFLTEGENICALPANDDDSIDGFVFGREAYMYDKICISFIQHNSEWYLLYIPIDNQLNH